MIIKSVFISIKFIFQNSKASAEMHNSLGGGVGPMPVSTLMAVPVLALLATWSRGIAGLSHFVGCLCALSVAGWLHAEDPLHSPYFTHYFKSDEPEKERELCEQVLKCALHVMGHSSYGKLRIEE